MSRRDAFKTAAGLLLATFVRPAPRRLLDLSEFCGDKSWRWDFRMPYAVGDWTYATDSRTCVRVRPMPADVADHTAKVPPFESLLWDHDRHRGWQPLPPLRPLVAADSDCPTCDGHGWIGDHKNPPKCPTCKGTGTDPECTHLDCRPCQGSGNARPDNCPRCQGHGVGDFPALVELDGTYFDRKQYERVYRLGGEFVMSDYPRTGGRFDVCRFRFAEGDGLMLGLDQERARERLAAV